MPLGELIARLDPPPQADVLQAARKLNHRAFVIVGLIVNASQLFPDQWIYVHSPDVQVGRIQNFGNWSAAMVPDPRQTSLGMEYFCTEGDDVWTMSDADLIHLATRELVKLKLAEARHVVDGIVFRQPGAYPVYDAEYRDSLTILRRFLATIENLQTVGRNGMHRYNNLDHSMLTGMLAVGNLLGEDHDLWQVNTESSYHEQAPSDRST
jgi:protoporphyrinogen oxidase